MRFLILQERERTLSTLTYDCVSLLNNQLCERRKRRPEPTGDEEDATDDHRLSRRDHGGRLGAAHRLRAPPQRRLGRRGRRCGLVARRGLLFDQNNIRYVSSTHIGEWARDKSARCVLLPREGDPVLWDFGSAAKHHRLYAPGARVELAGRRHLDARGDAARDRRARRAGRPHPARAGRARARRRAAGDRPDRHGDAVLAAAPGDRDGRRAARDDAGAGDQDGGGDRAARARRGDRRRGLRGDLPPAAARRARARDRATRHALPVRARLGAGRGDQRRLGRPLQPASARLLGPPAAARRPGVLRRHPLVHGLPDVLLPDVQRGRRDALADRRLQAVPRVARPAIELVRPARRPTRSRASGRPRRSSASPTSRRASACSSGTAWASACTRRR